jgi:hypothetical protein
MSDSGLVDAAVMEVLANDATLTALCPDGVFWGRAPAGATAFVIAALIDHSEQPALDRQTLYETTVYLVKAVILNASKTPSRTAAARIHVLLHGAQLDLAPAGYQVMACQRLERVAYPELDPINAVTWHHGGGQYAVMSYPIA